LEARQGACLPLIVPRHRPSLSPSFHAKPRSICRRVMPSFLPVFVRKPGEAGDRGCVAWVCLPLCLALVVHSVPRVSICLASPLPSRPLTPLHCRAPLRHEHARTHMEEQNMEDLRRGRGPSLPRRPARRLSSLPTHQPTHSHWPSPNNSTHTRAPNLTHPSLPSLPSLPPHPTGSLPPPGKRAACVSALEKGKRSD